MGWRDGLRAILAGLAVFAFTGIVVGVVIGSGLADAVGPVVAGLLMGGAMVIACIGALVLFNMRRRDSRGLKSVDEQLRELEAGGLLVSADYRATRAFEVEELEDEGLHYFLELDDGRVLSLTGQYLYDYEPDPEIPRPRRFPCDDFTVRRHRDHGYVVDLVCRGRVLEPELTAPAFPFDVAWSKEPLEDVELIADTYDAVKARATRRVR